jgi:hypothetical protein
MPLPEQQSPTPMIQGEDDWSKLRYAADALRVYLETPDFGWADYDPLDRECGEILAEYVPKLIDSWAELWGLSQVLLASVEAWKAQGSGGQLLVADEGEVRQFGK